MKLKNSHLLTALWLFAVSLCLLVLILMLLRGPALTP